MAHDVLLLNGPNLNMLGVREPEVYGADTLEDIVARVTAHAGDRAVISHVQSNHEGELVEALHAAHGTRAGVVFNPGAYTHTSVALRDAISACGLPVVETHLSNVHAREEFRHRSLLAGVCLGVVAGFGWRSYTVALDGLLAHLDASAS